MLQSLKSKELRDVLVDNQGIAPGRVKRVENGFWKTNVLIYLSALAGSRTIGTLPRKKICSETKSRPLRKKIRIRTHHLIFTIIPSYDNGLRGRSAARAPVK